MSNKNQLRNGYPWLPKNKRKTILLLSDDIRLHSGVATMAREFVMGTAHYFNWINIGAAINNPDFGKIQDLSETVQKEENIKDASVIIYPNNGYGDPDLVRTLLQKHNIDGILHFTDPRFWGWLYNMENEIRQNIPIMYYALWDDLPYPNWNNGAYRSCDLIMSISKQSENIHKQVLRKYNNTNTKVTYVPHGINSKVFRPLEAMDPEFDKFKYDYFGEDKTKWPEFVVFHNSRNITRKGTSDLLLGYKFFVDSLPKEKRDKVLLLLHTQPVDQHGTDLFAVINNLLAGYNVRFTTDKKISSQVMNYFYNIANVTLQPSSAEGFGLSVAESLMSGTPIIASVIGGLQDQMAFRNLQGGLIKFFPDFPTNSQKTYEDCGEWAFPLWPQSNLKGSIPTPYIYDSRVPVGEITNQLVTVYNLGDKKRKEVGLKGREWMMSDESMMSSTNMAKGFIRDMSECFKTFKPQHRFKMYKVDPPEETNQPVGVWDDYSKTWI